MNILQINDEIQKKNGELSLSIQKKEEFNNKMQRNIEVLEDIEEARVFLQEKAYENQQRLSIHINNFISDILQVIWGDKAYKFELKFVPKRGKTEVEMSLIDECGSTSLRKPNNIRNGGGVLGIIGFGLRIALWSLKEDKKYTMVFDQPFQNLDNEHLPRASELLESISKKLGLQFIIINHNPNLAGCADKTYKVAKDDKISHVELIT